MRITVDRNACEGHGQCAAVAPDLFYLDDGGELHLTYDAIDIPAALTNDARQGLACCPVLALHELTR
jgi:ferredoxin